MEEDEIIFKEGEHPLEFHVRVNDKLKVEEKSTPPL